MATLDGCVGEKHDAAETAIRPRGRLIPGLLIGRARSPSAGLAAAAVIVAAVTLLIYPLQQLDPGVSSGVLYVLAVLIVSVCWGLRLGMVTSVASAAALYFLHTSPAGFHAKNAGDLVAIGTLLVTASVASIIADSAARSNRTTVAPPLSCKRRSSRRSRRLASCASWRMGSCLRPSLAAG
jgi:K+-sensing histidine kinase KdpD